MFTMELLTTIGCFNTAIKINDCIIRLLFKTREIRNVKLIVTKRSLPV